MQYSYAAARLAPLVLALATASIDAQVNANRQGPEPRASAINIEKVNKRPLSRVEASIKEYESLLAATPNDAIILNNLGAMYFLAGRHFESQSMLRKAQLRAPELLPIRVNLAVALNKTYNPALAIKTLEGVIAEDAGQYRARQILCEFYAQEERDADSIACYEPLYSSGKMDAVAASNFATSLLDAGQIDRAMEILNWADSKFPDDAGVKNGLGVVLFKKKKYKLAETNLQRAVALEPRSAQVRFNLAMAQMATNNRGAVLEQYKFLKTSDPELAGQLYKLVFKDKVVSVKNRQ